MYKRTTSIRLKKNNKFDSYLIDRIIVIHANNFPNECFLSHNGSLNNTKGQMMSSMMDGMAYSMNISIGNHKCTLNFVEGQINNIVSSLSNLDNPRNNPSISLVKSLNNLVTLSISVEVSLNKMEGLLIKIVRSLNT